MPWIIYMRGIVGFLEIVAIVTCLVGLHLPVVNAFQKECEELAPRLRFARGVVFFQVALYMLFLLKICLYSDPLGISTPGLLEKLRMLDDTDSRGSLLEDSTTVEMTPGGQLDNLFLPQATNEPLKLTNEVNIWTKQRRSVFRLNENDIENVTKIHNDHVSRKNYERRLKAIFCCLGIQGHKSRGAALEDVARGLYTVFSETDVVLSDIIAGFALLKKYQHKVKKRKGEAGLTNKFRMVRLSVLASICLVLSFLFKLPFSCLSNFHSHPSIPKFSFSIIYSHTTFHFPFSFLVLPFPLIPFSCFSSYTSISVLLLDTFLMMSFHSLCVFFHSHQSTSILINPLPFSSIHFGCHQSTSILINPLPFSSIHFHSHQSTSILINPLPISFFRSQCFEALTKIQVSLG